MTEGIKLVQGKSWLLGIVLAFFLSACDHKKDNELAQEPSPIGQTDLNIGNPNIGDPNFIPIHKPLDHLQSANGFRLLKSFDDGTALINGIVDAREGLRTFVIDGQSIEQFGTDINLGNVEIRSELIPNTNKLLYLGESDQHRRALFLIDKTAQQLLSGDLFVNQFWLNDQYALLSANTINQEGDINLADQAIYSLDLQSLVVTKIYQLNEQQYIFGYGDTHLDGRAVPRYSSDFQKIAFALGDDETNNISLHTIDADGSNHLRLVDNLQIASRGSNLNYHFLFNFTPNAKRLIYVSRIEENVLASVKVDGGDIQSLTTSLFTGFISNIDFINQQGMLIKSSNDFYFVDQLGSEAISITGAAPVRQNEKPIIENELIIYPDENNDLFTFNTSNQVITQLNPNIEINNISNLQLSQDGNFLIFIANSPNTLYRAQIKEGGVEVISSQVDDEHWLNIDYYKPQMPPMSGDKIAYFINGDRFYISNVDGSEVAAIDHPYPTMAKNSKQHPIVFVEGYLYFSAVNPSGIAELYRYHLISQTTENLSGQFGQYIDDDVQFYFANQQATVLAAIDQQERLHTVYDGVQCVIPDINKDGRFIRPNQVTNDSFYFQSEVRYNDGPIKRLDLHQCTINEISQGLDQEPRGLNVINKDQLLVFTKEEGLYSLSGDGTQLIDIKANVAFNGMDIEVKDVHVNESGNKFILYLSDKNTSLNHIYSFDANGTNPTELSTMTMVPNDENTDQTISLNGQWLMFWQGEEGSPIELYKVKLDGSELTQLTGIEEASLPEATTTHHIFRSDNRLFKVNLDGVADKQLISSTVNDTEMLANIGSRLTHSPQRISDRYFEHNSLLEKVVFLTHSKDYKQKVHIANLTDLGLISIEMGVNQHVLDYTLTSNFLIISSVNIENGFGTVYINDLNSELLTPLFTQPYPSVENIFALLDSDNITVILKRDGVRGLYKHNLMDQSWILVKEIPVDRRAVIIRSNPNQVIIKGDLRIKGVDEIFSFDVNG